MKKIHATLQSQLESLVKNGELERPEVKVKKPHSADALVRVAMENAIPLSRLTVDLRKERVCRVGDTNISSIIKEAATLVKNNKISPGVVSQITSSLEGFVAPKKAIPLPTLRNLVLAYFGFDVDAENARASVTIEQGILVSTKVDEELKFEYYVPSTL